jgi:hypothetical protein
LEDAQGGSESNGTALHILCASPTAGRIGGFSERDQVIQITKEVRHSLLTHSEWKKKSFAVPCRVDNTPAKRIHFGGSGIIIAEWNAVWENRLCRIGTGTVSVMKRNEHVRIQTVVVVDHVQ